MNKPFNPRRRVWLVVWLLLLATGCRGQAAPASVAAPVTAPGTPAAPEYAVQELTLSGPIAQPKAEISGMALHADWLFLLPQYPQRMADSASGALYALPRPALEAYLRGEQPTPPEARPIAFYSDGVEKLVPGFEGFEAIAFQGQRVYLTIEGRSGLRMTSHVIAGEFDPLVAELRLDAATLTEIPQPANASNHSHEALLVMPERLLAFYELNGAEVVPSRMVAVFGMDLQPMLPLPFPLLEYRLTDAAPVGDDERFWVINYFFPDDTNLRPKEDLLVEKYGQGATHVNSDVIERLVEYRLSAEGITRTETPPLQLELRSDGAARNWEGLAYLPGLGFMLVTDKFPHTILTFVPYEEPPR